MLAGLMGTCVATCFSVWVQFHDVVHIRPLLDPALHLAGFQGPGDFGRLSSFPSDTATLFFALSLVLFLEHRAAGAVAFAWSFLTVGIIRVAAGFHYPSDIAASFLLGPGCVLLFTQFRFPREWFERLLHRLEKHMALVEGLLYLFLADAYTQFLGFQEALKTLKAITLTIVGR
jgi:undecaprenyl-diphosphatase